MNSIHTWVGTAFIVLQMTFSARAVGSEETTLSLTDAYRLALRKNDEVRAADEALYQARLWPKRAYTLLTPKLSLMGTYTLQQEIRTSVDLSSIGLPGTLTSLLPKTSGLSLLVQPSDQYLLQATV